MTTGPVIRPRIHFTPRSGWINDPLGLTFHDGRYHLFFQFAPGTTTWSPRAQWGHATSPDGLHWTEGSVALAPGDGDGGVWSGSLVCPPGEAAVIFYTAVDEADPQVGRVRRAVAADEGWVAWDKGEVVVPAPPSSDVVVFRDPWVFPDGDRWRMVVGAGLADGTALAFGYVSDDLRHWDETGPALTRHRDETEPLWTGSVWECPQLFRIGDDWVLTVSVWEPFVPHYEAYAIGTFADGRFTPRCWARLTYGPSYYAGSAYGERDGRRGIVYWLRGVDDVASGWASAHSVPHALRVEGDRLVAQPHAAVERLRGEPVPLGPGATEASVDAFFDLDWTVSLGDNLSVTGPDGAEAVHLEAAPGQLAIRVGDQTWTVPLVDDRVRVLLDGPIVEVFATAGVFAAPLLEMPPTVSVRFVGHGSVRVHRLESAATA
jgi:beta-fructofuranosidase